MKKVFIVLIIFSIIILNSCFKRGDIFFNDDKIIDKSIEKIIEAINKKDVEDIKIIFCNEVLNEYINFEEQVVVLFEFIQGEIESWKRTGGPSTSLGNNDDGSGRIWKVIQATYDIETNKGKYHVSLQEILKFSQDSNKIGISSFCIINANDWNEDYNYWGGIGSTTKFEILGISINHGNDF